MSIKASVCNRGGGAFLVAKTSAPKAKRSSRRVTIFESTFNRSLLEVAELARYGQSILFGSAHAVLDIVVDDEIKLLIGEAVVLGQDTVDLIYDGLREITDI